MFSDETNIQPEQIGEPTEQLSTFLQSTQGSSRDQLWYGVEFSAHGMNDFHVVEGRLNASDYIGILEDKVVPFTVRVFRNGNLSFQQGNAPCHTARTVWTERKGLQPIHWPSNSPDLNINEHVWPLLKSEVRKALKSERKQDLLEAIGRAWYSCISSQEIEKLYESISKRTAECGEAKGGDTEY